MSSISYRSISIFARSISSINSSPARPVYCSVRYLSSRNRPDPAFHLFRPDNTELMQEFKEGLEAQKVKYRRHPGTLHIGMQKVEKDIQKAIGRILVKSETKLPTYIEQGEALERYLKNRRLPMENHDLVKLRSDIERRLREKLANKGKSPELCETEEDRVRLEESIQKKTDRRLETSIYRWKPMQYNTRFKCMTYCVMRFAPEYAALRRAFNEIVKREPSFRPRHVLDFGSGIGTTFFATETAWPADSEGGKRVEEYFCIEPNDEMNDVFRLLLQDGEPEKQPRHPNVTLRSYLPASSDRQFDLVVSAYSLFELPSYEERMRTVANLWMKTDKFLVLIERGTNAGFRAIVEARDYILAGGHEIYRTALPSLAEQHVNIAEVERILKLKDKTEAEKFRLLRERYPDVEFPTLLPHGHVFAPCPHEMGCPRLLDVTPCNFSARYLPLRLSGGEEVHEEEVFSFIILKKGYAPESSDRWARIVREPRKSKACIWCQTCTPHGVLEDRAFHKGPNSTERGKQFRLLAKSWWGDMLPIVTSYDSQNEARSGEEGNVPVDQEEIEFDDEEDGLDDSFVHPKVTRDKTQKEE